MRSRLELSVPVVIAVVVAGCGGHKITSAHAAALLKADEPTWTRVVCRPYAGGSYWDYACRIRSTIAALFSFEVKVNDSRIVDRSAP
jgi:hypothetical protein